MCDLHFGGATRNVIMQFVDACQSLWKSVDTAQMVHTVQMVHMVLMVHMLNTVYMLPMVAHRRRDS